MRWSFIRRSEQFHLGRMFFLSLPSSAVNSWFISIFLFPFRLPFQRWVNDWTMVHEQPSNWMMHDRKSRMRNNIDNKFRNKSVMMKYWNKKKTRRNLSCCRSNFFFRFFRLPFRHLTTLRMKQTASREIWAHCWRRCALYTRYFTFRTLHGDERNDIYFRNI